MGNSFNETQINFIHSTTSEPDAGLDLMHRKFIENDYLTKQDVKDFVTNTILPKIEGVVSKEEKAYFIIHALQFDHILNYLQNHQTSFKGTWQYAKRTGDLRFIPEPTPDGNEQIETVTKHEVNEWLVRLQEAVLSELPTKVDNSIILLVSRYLGTKQRIAEVHRDASTIVRGNLDEEDIDQNNPSYLQQLYALEKLYDLDERNEYIAYTTDVVDRDYGRSLEKKLHMTTLLEFIRNGNNISFKRVLKYITEYLKGCIFLLDNGLAISDHKLSNVGINLDTDTGMVFDFDGLARMDFPLVSYSSHDDGFPPELKQHDLDKGLLYMNEMHMVFELGVLIEEVVDVYSDTYPNKKHEIPKGFYNFAMQMQSTDPANRPPGVKNILETLQNLEKLQVNI